MGRWCVWGIGGNDKSLPLSDFLRGGKALCVCVGGGGLVHDAVGHDFWAVEEKFHTTVQALAFGVCARL